MNDQAAEMPATTSGASLPSKRDIEKALRTAGLSARQSKKLLSRGWSAIAADDDQAELAEQLENFAKKLRGNS